MDIELARTFLTVLETGNFGRAADRLEVTQSTVSMRIKTLETLLGRPVFTRSKSGVAPTSAGELFKRSAETIVRAWNQACQEVALPPAYQGVLTIGGQFTLWDRLLLRWLPWVRGALPDVAIRAEVGLTEGLMRNLAEGLLDIAVLYSPQSRPGLVAEELLEEPLVMAASPGASDSPHDSGYIYVDWGPEFRSAHTAAFPNLAAPALSVSHGPLGLEYILDNGGSGYFPMRMVRDALAAGRLRLVETAPRFRRPAFMVYSGARDDARFLTALQGLRYVASVQAEGSAG